MGPPRYYHQHCSPFAMQLCNSLVSAEQEWTANAGTAGHLPRAHYDHEGVHARGHGH